jgi:hypothetical protein
LLPGNSVDSAQKAAFRPKILTKIVRFLFAAALPLGSVGYEPEANAKGERLIWRDARPRR